MIAAKILVLLLPLLAWILTGCASTEHLTSDDWPVFTPPTNEQWMQEHKAEKGWYWPERPKGY